MRANKILFIVLLLVSVSPVQAIDADWILGKWELTYDPDGDGQISVDEVKEWDPYESPIHIQILLPH